MLNFQVNCYAKDFEQVQYLVRAVVSVIRTALAGTVVKVTDKSGDKYSYWGVEVPFYFYRFKLYCSMNIE